MGDLAEGIVEGDLHTVVARLVWRVSADPTYLCRSSSYSQDLLRKRFGSAEFNAEGGIPDPFQCVWRIALQGVSKWIRTVSKSIRIIPGMRWHGYSMIGFSYSRRSLRSWR